MNEEPFFLSKKRLINRKKKQETAWDDIYNIFIYLTCCGYYFTNILYNGNQINESINQATLIHQTTIVLSRCIHSELYIGPHR